MKLWKRYLFKQLVSTFFFILIAIFTLYVVVDLSEHSVGVFQSDGISFKTVLSYYANTFLVFLDFFFPLAFLLASLKTLLDLNQHQELVALQMAGISKAKILTPFFIFATLLSSLSYTSGEWLAPKAHEIVDKFRNTHAKKKKKFHGKHLYTQSLDDQSELLYQTYDRVHQTLFDCFWIRSKTEIWRFELFHLETKLGENVELISYEEHQWRRKEFAQKKVMDEMILEEKAIERFIPIPNRPLRSLVHQIRSHLPEKSMAQAHFYYKLMRPLLSFFVIMAVAPMAMRFGRGRSHWTLIALSLGSFFAFMTILDGMLLIGETHLLPPFIAILIPFAILLIARFRPFIQI